MHLQHQLVETRTERDHLNGECCNRTYTESTKLQSSCFIDELKMVKKISSGKDLELDEIQTKVKVFEGELMCACIDSLAFVHLHMSSLHEWKHCFAV